MHSLLLLRIKCLGWTRYSARPGEIVTALILTENHDYCLLDIDHVPGIMLSSSVYSFYFSKIHMTETTFIPIVQGKKVIRSLKWILMWKTPWHLSSQRPTHVGLTHTSWEKVSCELTPEACRCLSPCLECPYPFFIVFEVLWSIMYDVNRNLHSR